MADSQLQGVYVALRCRECMPIMFRREENFVGNCMEFVRSMPVTDNFGNVQSESFKLSELGIKEVRSLDACFGAGLGNSQCMRTP